MLNLGMRKTTILRIGCGIEQELVEPLGLGAFALAEQNGRHGGAGLAAVAVADRARKAAWTLLLSFATR